MILSILSVVLFFFGARQFGLLEAKYDLLRGRYEIHGYGLIWGEPPEIAALRPYGIEYRHVAGCLINDFIIESVTAYNATMLQAINTDFGIDIDHLKQSYAQAPDFEEIQKAFDAKPPGNTENCLDETKEFMQTLEPEGAEGAVYEIGDCFKIDFADYDHDAVEEAICLRYLKYKEYDDTLVYTSLVVDIFSGIKHVLRQEIDRDFYFEERYVGINDIDQDNRAELITRVRLGPDCAGCSAYRIYIFQKDRFEHELNLYGIKPEHASLKGVLDKLADYDDMILDHLKQKTKTEHPCGFYDGCQTSAPWMVDSDRDGQPEVVMLVEPPRDDFDFSDQVNYMFIARHSATGQFVKYHLIPIQLACCAFTDVLGFLRTRDQRTHMLINFAYPGTSAAYPVLNIFEINGPQIRKVGEFAGFYEHAIAERLRDMDGDGNTEIIYVDDVYWPPGKSHAEIMAVYAVADFQSTRYIKANDRFRKEIEELNKLY